MPIIDQLERADAVARLWAKDPSLFTTDDAGARRIEDRLGWLGLAGSTGPVIEEADSLGRDMQAGGIRDVLLLGMGGSSLAPLVLTRILPARDGAPRLTVLDTSSPEAVAEVRERVDPASCACIVASKSGGTIEPNSLYRVFREWIEGAVDEDEVGERFIAITDPGSPLERLARDDGFRRVFTTPSDVGGRYSALTAFGLAPATICGVDTSAVAERAVRMEQECRKPEAVNPGAHLAAWMMSAYHSGRDKLTLAASDRLRPLGLWIEQLIAESTGKSGRGLVPIIEQEPDPDADYGSDRMLAVLRLADDDGMERLATAERGPLPCIDLVLDDVYDLGAEFVRWEAATALLGHLMGIDPFDEPNVTEAKQKTASLLDGEIAAPEPSVQVDGFAVTYATPLGEPDTPDTLAAALAAHVGSLAPSDYLAVLAYLPEDEDLLGPLRSAVLDVSRATMRAATLQLGPRYLHSTGQLHKGGADRGVFIVVTAAEGPDVPVRGESYTLRRLIRAQADGDMVTLASHGRRVAGVEMPEASSEHVRRLAEALRLAAGIA